MGTTYDYWNQDKRQYFSCGLGIENDKRSGIGRGSSARALGLLLRYDWAGDRIAVIGDDQSTEWRDGAIDISVDLMLMLLDIDGTGWIDFDGCGFAPACELATYVRYPRLIAVLDAMFGPAGWRKRFEDHSRANSSTLANDIYEAQQRGIISFRAAEAER